MKRFWHMVIWTCCLIVTWSCSARVGPETADGTYLNLNGEAVNVYAYPRAVTVRTGLEVLALMRSTVRSMDTHDQETVILGAAPDGSPLQLRFIREGRALTGVQVRTGALGYWDHEFSYQFHALIMDRLKRGAPREPATAPDPPAPAASGGSDSDRPVARRIPDPPPRKVPIVPESPDAVPVPTGPGATASAPLAKSLERPLPTPAVSVYFNEDSNFPEPGEMTKLEQVAAELFANPAWEMSLMGFADSSENGGNPRIVAESRVLAVKFYFIGKGVDAARLSTAAHEMIRNENTVNLPNRPRVEIRLIQKPRRDRPENGAEAAPRHRMR